MSEEQTAREEAHHLRLIANDLRLAGNIGLVEFTDPERMLNDPYDPDRPRSAR